ncbi:hypothetical protein P9112_001444 [Eukaryota sp. TZLM1-RC]
MSYLVNLKNYRHKFGPNVFLNQFKKFQTDLYLIYSFAVKNFIHSTSPLSPQYKLCSKFISKNFHSKTDHCTRKNTEKPPLRSLRSVARSINNSVSRNLFSPAETAKSQKSISTFNSKIDKIERTEKMKPLPLKGSKKCSICGISGHNSRTCPEKQKREFELKSAQQILKCSVPAVAVVKGAENNVSDDQQLNASSVPSSSPSENSNFCCPFCKKDFCCKKLQQKLSKIFESLDFDVRLGLAKKKNPAFANLLQDMCDSTSSALVTTIPQVYGTLLSDSAWTLNMRFRSFIWPDNLPHNLICKCSREITTTHLLNCKHFITF